MIVRIPDGSSYAIKSRVFDIIDSEMYELSEKANNKFGEPLLSGEHDIVVQNPHRSCTDICCLILFLLFVGAFIGLLAYGIISGDPKKVINAYNIQQVQCYNTPSTTCNPPSTQTASSPRSDPSPTRFA
jgi:hypothetical protein